MEGALQGAALPPGSLDQRVEILQAAFGESRDFLADRRDGNATIRAVDEIRAEQILELLNGDAKRRL